MTDPQALAALVDELCDRLPSDLPDDDYKTYSVEISVGAIKALRQALSALAPVGVEEGEVLTNDEQAIVRSLADYFPGAASIVTRLAQRLAEVTRERARDHKNASVACDGLRAALTAARQEAEILNGALNEIAATPGCANAADIIVNARGAIIRLRTPSPEGT